MVGLILVRRSFYLFVWVGEIEGMYIREFGGISWMEVVGFYILEESKN